jgi:hypothetical protein
MRLSSDFVPGGLEDLDLHSFAAQRPLELADALLGGPQAPAGATALDEMLAHSECLVQSGSQH